MSAQITNNAPVCQRDSGAFNAEQQRRYQTLRQEIYRTAQDFNELPNGYGIRFPTNKDMLVTLAEFITLERQCCAFFDFTLRVESGSEQTWFELTGADGVKGFLGGELGLDTANG